MMHVALMGKTNEHKILFEDLKGRYNCGIQDDSKLLSVFPWPIIFKPEKQNKTAYGI
jgi:hypothetical protein